jgi:hypothetical protein
MDPHVRMRRIKRQVIDKAEAMDHPCDAVVSLIRGCVTWCERVRARSIPFVVRLFDQRCLSCSMTIRKPYTWKKAAQTR